MFLNIFTSGYLHVYKEVRSVSTREGTDICEFAHDGFVHKSFYDLKDVYLRVFACKQRGSNCERSQGHKQNLSLHNMGSYRHVCVM